MRKKRLLSKKILHVLAVAALSVSLLGGQMHAVFAEDPVKVNAIKVEENRLVLEPVYVKSGMPLSEIELPKFEDGLLKWEDETYIPDSEEIECTIIFTPNKQKNLEKYKYLEGWDSKEKIVKTKIKVVVEDFQEEINAEETVIEETTAGETFAEMKDETNVEDPEWGETEDIIDEEELFPDEEDEIEDIVEEEDSFSEEEEEIEDIVEEEDSFSEEEEEIEDIVDEEDSFSEEEEEIEDIVDEEDSFPEEEEEIEDIIEEDSFPGENEEIEDIIEEEDSLPEEKEEAADSITNEEISAPEENEAEDIFNRDLVCAETDDRQLVIDEDISEEEKLKFSEENHYSNGIAVTGNELPWYVQFRAYEIEETDFSINEDTNVFRCFEFELWDLRTNTEYIIPDGEYVSVIIPVLEGYDYTVEHLLDNGAVEMITPTVTGSTLVFSTHSFSPFGIAGSTTIVGGELMDDGYQTPTDTPTPTASPTIVQTPSASVGGQTILVGEELESPGSKEETTNTVSPDKSQQNKNDSDLNKEVLTKLPVQTGDTSMILGFALKAAVSLVGILICIILKKDLEASEELDDF